MLAPVPAPLQTPHLVFRQGGWRGGGKEGEGGREREDWAEEGMGESVG